MWAEWETVTHSATVPFVVIWVEWRVSGHIQQCSGVSPGSDGQGTICGVEDQKGLLHARQILESPVFSPALSCAVFPRV